jgi:large subunit ribosomal protein L6
MENKKRQVKPMNMEIELPSGINAKVEANRVQLTGQKGEVKRDFSDKDIEIKNEGNKIFLNASKPGKRNKKRIKSYIAHIKNMIKGCSEGHTYVLKICSGHFPMNVSISNNQIIVKNFLGEKVPRTLKLTPGAQVKIEGDKIIVESPSKEIAGQISSNIELLTRRTKYDIRIFQDGVWIISKDGREIR